MSPFWGSLFEALRGHGRNGTLFIATVLTLAAVLLLVRTLPPEFYSDYALPAALGVLLLAALRLLRNWLRRRSGRSTKNPERQLSRDEVNKARSKLVKGQMR
jgi:hypothetical protein